MANYQLGPVIGKLGGTDVQVQPFSVRWTGSGDSQEDRPIHTVGGDTDQDYLVATIGTYQNSNSTQKNQPEVIAGGLRTKFSFENRDAVVGLSFVARGGDTIMMRKNSYSHASVSYVGHVYVVPLPD